MMSETPSSNPEDFTPEELEDIAKEDLQREEVKRKTQGQETVNQEESLEEIERKENEQRWDDPLKDSDDLLSLATGKITNKRKLQLFAVSCFKSVSYAAPIARNEHNRRGIEIIERLADGNATDEERALLKNDIGIDVPAIVHYNPINADNSWPLAVHSVYWSSHMAGDSIFPPPTEIIEERVTEARQKERFTQANLLRDIFSNPFSKEKPQVKPEWLSWNDGTVRKLAQAAYEERNEENGQIDMGYMGILADALEEAGCTDVHILEHLRGKEVHVRGCWVLDLILQKDKRNEERE